jgi:hypothetical protein
LLGLAVLAVAAVVLPVPAAARAALAVSPTRVSSPAVAVGAGGDTVVAWARVLRKRVVIEARAGREPDSLGPVQRFTAGSGPRVAVGADGSAAMIWVERGGTLRAALARPGRRFGAARAIGTAHHTAGVAIQPSGRVVVAWSDKANRLRVATASRTGSFGAPHTLGRVGFEAPTIALDPRDGTVVLAYPTNDKSSRAAVTTLAADASTFTAPVQFTTSDVSAATAIAGPGGEAVAITAGGLQLARRGADGQWAPPEPLASSPDNAGTQFPAFLSSPTAALLADGSAIGVWWLQVPATDASAELLTGEVYAAGQLLTPADGIATPPSVVAIGDEAFIASAVDDGPVDLFTLPAGATTTLSPKSEGDVHLAASGTHVLAAFLHNDRLNLTVIR